MKIELIHRVSPPVYGPETRCQCLLHNADHILRRKKQEHTFGRRQPHRCTRDSTYRIDGIALCAQHAGKLALGYLIEEGRRHAIQN